MASEKETVTVEFPIKFGWLGCGIYIALGIVYHLVMGDGPFTWTDPWLYASMFLWPFFLLGWIIVWGIGIAVVVGGIWLACAWWEDRKRAQNAAAHRARLDEEREQRRRELAKATPSQD